MSRNPRVGQTLRTYVQHLRNERQNISIVGTPNAGAIALRVGSELTEPFALTATALDVQEALEALYAIGNEGVVCYGGPLDEAAINVVFIGSKVQHRNMPQLQSEHTLNNGASVSIVTPEPGGLVDGGTVTFVATNGATTINGTVVNVGLGVDAIDWTPTVAGVWKVRVSGTQPTPHTVTERITIDP